MPKTARLIGDAVACDLYWQRGGFRSRNGLRKRTELTSAELMTWIIAGRCLPLSWWQRELFGLPDNQLLLSPIDVVVDLFSGTGAFASVFDAVHVLEVLQQQLATDPDHADGPALSGCEHGRHAVAHVIAAGLEGDATVLQGYRSMLEGMRAMMPFLQQARHLIVEMGSLGHLHALGVPVGRARRQDGQYQSERIIPSAFSATSFITPNGLLVDQPAVVRAGRLRFPVDSVLEIWPLGPIRDLEPRLWKPSPYVLHLRAKEAEERKRARGGRPRSPSEQRMKELFLELRAAGRLAGNANAIARQLCDRAATLGIEGVPEPRFVAEWVRGWLEEIQPETDQRTM